jgi:hypothetical protein
MNIIEGNHCIVVIFSSYFDPPDLYSSTGFQAHPSSETPTSSSDQPLPVVEAIRQTAIALIAQQLNAAGSQELLNRQAPLSISSHMDNFPSIIDAINDTSVPPDDDGSPQELPDASHHGAQDSLSGNDNDSHDEPFDVPSSAAGKFKELYLCSKA